MNARDEHGHRELALVAQRLTTAVREDCQPTHRDLHIVRGGAHDQLLVVNGSRLYELPADTADELRSRISADDEGALTEWLQQAGLDVPPVIDSEPLAPLPPHALSLAVAQRCNLGCTYCYAEQGSFGGVAKNMPLETALSSVDALMREVKPGERVSLAFLGGEPLQNRNVVRAATAYATQQAALRDARVTFSITTNGTLVTGEDAEFFEQYGFAVTVSIDGPASVHDRLRPMKGGQGSFARIIDRITPLLERQARMQVSARVTVTPVNLDLLATLDLLIQMGFHSVGFSPLLHSPQGSDELDRAGLAQMLESMVLCGLAFEQHVLRGERYPFLNMTNAMRELHRGTHRPYPCGAGAGYFGVSADGNIAACHRFVDGQQGQFGSLRSGIDRARQVIWLSERHVHRQQPCVDCWARYLCGGGCHHETLARGRQACDFIRGWLHYTIQAYSRLNQLSPDWFADASGGVDRPVHL